MGQRPCCGWTEVYRLQKDVLIDRALQLNCVRQRRENDCGLASIATVAAHHRREVEYDELTDSVTLDCDGTDLLTLTRVAERLNFRTQGVMTRYDGIPACHLPAIAHFRGSFGFRHFVVLHRWSPAFVVIADPAIGMRKFSRKSFCRRWTGYLLLIYPWQ